MGFFNETIPADMDSTVYHQSRQPTLIGVNAMYIIVCLVAVSLRLYVRLRQREKLWWDDMFAFLCAIFAMIISALNIAQLPNGFGRHDAVILNTNPNLYSRYGKLNCVILVFYCSSLGLFKWSVLAFYCRVFHAYRRIVWSSIIIGIAVLIWVIITMFVQIFQCKPISYVWNNNMAQPEGHCWIQQSQTAFIHSVPSVFFDACILFLPAHRVWSLNLSRQKRIGAFCVFLSGGLVLMISLIRLGEMVDYVKHLHAPDPLFYRGLTVCLWSIAEPVAGLVSCCMVTYWPLVRSACRIFGIQISPNPNTGVRKKDIAKSWLRNLRNGGDLHQDTIDTAYTKGTEASKEPDFLTMPRGMSSGSGSSIV